MRVIIVSDYTKWEKTVNMLENYRRDVAILGCCDYYRPQISEEFSTAFAITELPLLYRNGQIDAVVNADAPEREINEYLQSEGVPNFAIKSSMFRKDELSAKEAEELLQPYGEIEAELAQVEYHLADHCNLNCASCAHFSNLVKEPVFADLAQFEKDLHRLKELFSHIERFSLLGGEPLLNGEIDKFIRLLHELFPYTEIIVVSNGLLVLSMKEELLELFRDAGVRLAISEYQFLDTEKLRAFLDAAQIRYTIRSGKEEFNKYLSTKKAEDVQAVFDACTNRRCNFLSKGAIAACGQPFYIRYFNEYFGEDFSDGGAISLYEEGIDGNEILRRLAQPMGACSNCTFPQPVSWHAGKDSIRKEDWCVR